MSFHSAMRGMNTNEQCNGKSFKTDDYVHGGFNSVEGEGEERCIDVENNLKKRCT